MLLRFVTPLLAGLLLAWPLTAQSLLSDALSTLPAETVFLEYENLSQLRSLPGYDSLRNRYAGKRLQELAQAFVGFGIDDDALEEIVLASRNKSGAGTLFGLMSGAIDLGAIARGAARHNLVLGSSGTNKIYCLPSEKGGICLAAAASSLLFGSFERIHSMLEVAAGRETALAATASVPGLMATDAFIPSVKGLVPGSEVANWIQTSLPAGLSIARLDWSLAFQSVTLFSYSVSFSTKAHVGMRFLCKSSETAILLEQELAALKLAALANQALSAKGAAWFENARVERSDTLVQLQLDSVLPAS